MSSNPTTHPDLYDSIEVAGTRSPGIVTLSGHEREMKLDVKDSDGQHGATTTWKGTKAGEFTASFRLIVDPSQLIDEVADWDEFAKVLWSTVPPVSGKAPQAKDIVHPDLQRNGYSSVILRKMGGLVHDGKGGAKVDCVLAEYFPPKPAGASSPKGGSKKTEGDKRIDNAMNELNNLLNDDKKAP
jgi:hypothetical protein